MGIRSFTAAATMLAMLSPVCMAATAQPGMPDDGLAKKLFAGESGKAKSFACFVRRYDADHLARHPLQKVTAMKLLVTAEKVPEDDHLNYSFRLGVKLRGQSANFDSGGSCGHAQTSADTAGTVRLGCSVDCDGGGITIEAATQVKSVIVKLEAVRLWKANAPQDEEIHSLQAGADDRIFRLDRASLDDCRSLVTDKEELAEMRRK